MKTSSWLPRLIKSRLLCLLVLILKITAAAENHFHLKYEGMVGGNVTFYCPVDDTQELQFLYFQKGDIFVNGYYIGKSVEDTWPNTRLDLNQTTIHMYGLNLSHAGEYTCYIMYINGDPHTIKLHLLVTASFSKPLITQRCEDNGCNVTCASHNGFPKQLITWQMEPDSNEMWKTEVLTDPTTKTLNVSSTGSINCSTGEVNVSCSVGSIISDVISVCAPTTSPSNNHQGIIAVTIPVILMGIVMIGTVICKCKKRMTVKHVATNDHAPEVIPLSGVEAAS
ncbi:uncharacterized protein LOC106521483 [Austrofundulus limnaeus]|uniref:Uncharacterized protein LOC106521483 n=1 Tax=Austrofundulus limnaeus TaxID=52670 RepID=A0A2I4BP41_AUSLI|nr:PREDICTED: uncharacterized protein LOC106521483 [Austrofundulus limnaeus]